MTHDGSAPLEAEISFTVGSHLAAASHARARVAQFCDELPANLQITAVLLTSELVTNALDQCEEAIHLHCTLTREGLCVEVTDDCEPHSAMKTPAAQAERGWRMQILESLSTAWGIRPSPAEHGTTVWFTLS